MQGRNKCKRDSPLLSWEACACGLKCQRLPSSLVVGVVGDAHLSGLEAMWKEGAWRDLAVEALKTPPPPEPFMEDEARGVKVLRRVLPHG